MGTSWPGSPEHSLVRVAGDPEALGRILAEHLVDALAFRLKDEWVSIAHIALCGGIITEAMLDALVDSYRSDRVDWRKVHVWWSDERYLAEGHIGRWETRARAAGLLRFGITEDHIHPVRPPAYDGEDAPDRAAKEYATLLGKFAPYGRPVPVFDVFMLRVGRVGEVGALYPGDASLQAVAPVVPVWNAPEAPAMRVTMTYPTINSSARVWLLGNGAECSEAVGRGVAGEDSSAVPAAGARGVLETVWWLDDKAARSIPGHLR